MDFRDEIYGLLEVLADFKRNAIFCSFRSRQSSKGICHADMY